MNSSDAMQCVTLITLGALHAHSDPVTGIKMTGGYMFSTSFDHSIMKWHAPINLAADTPQEFSQRNGEVLLKLIALKVITMKILETSFT